DLIYSPTSMISRMNFGQVREAVMGRIARAEGRPAVVPPFQAPTADQLQQRLRQAGLPEDSMEQLTLKGQPMPHRSTVGWVYWAGWPIPPRSDSRLLAASRWAPWAAGPSPLQGPGKRCTISSMSVQPPEKVPCRSLAGQRPPLVSPAWRTSCGLLASAPS
ncbi:MAG: hypothetical protein EXS58_11020, partial [Candidatus Latescibacteria bacterium]|nr:hypothetical protein [Candidatus Latescibacterota bacterium]